jgi:Co/Zn/Cd efflux system component
MSILDQIKLSLWDIGSIVIICLFILQKLIPLIKRLKKVILEIIKAYNEIKSSKQSNNPFNQIIQQNNSHNHQPNSNLSLPHLLHRNNILKQKRKAKREKGVRKKVKNKRIDLKGK